MLTRQLQAPPLSHHNLQYQETRKLGSEDLHANLHSSCEVNLSMEPSESTTTLPSTTNEDLTPLEQDVLDEYERLAENMKKVDVVTSVPPFAFEN